MGRHTVLDKHFLPEMIVFSLHMDLTVRSLFILRVLKKEQSTVLAVFGRKRYDIFTTSYFILLLWSIVIKKSSILVKFYKQTNDVISHYYVTIVHLTLVNCHKYYRM